MSRTASPPVAYRAVSLSRSMLLAGVSATALLVAAAGPAGARPLGGAATSAAATAAAAAQASAQAAAAAASQAMSRANASLQAMRNAQAAARAAALSGANRLGPQLPQVPDGLAPGGLNPTTNPAALIDGQPAWIGADQPAQSASANGRTQVEVVQRQPKAILTWDKFNVGRQTDLYFNQVAGGADVANWIALNRVLDPTAAPSQILGSIKAEGQVYIINQNGIIFGGASRVNVGALVASSLSLSNQQFLAGINAQLLIWNDTAASSIAMPQFGYLGQQKPNLFVGINDPQQIPAVTIGSAPGDVRVQAGASIEIASGGKALLFAPRVGNAGRIAAPDGQVIMAAGEQVFLMTDMTGVRGLDVAVSAPMPWAFNYEAMVAATTPFASRNLFQTDLANQVLPWMAQRAANVGYQAVNTGIVEAARGDITVMGREVVQNGALIASTALNNRNGSIRLRAWEQGMMSYSSTLEGSPLKYWSAGTLTLAPGSLTTVVPDPTDTETIEQTAVTARYTPGRVELRGKLVDIESLASVIVPAGTISIVASTSAMSPDTVVSNGEPTIRDGSRFYLGEDAFVSVAGLLDVPVATESNLVAVNMRINELRDSILYRDSWLRGVTVYVDKRKKGTFADGPMSTVNWIADSPGAWIGTPLGDASAWVGNGLTTLAELSTVGGKIAIKSSGSLITRVGSMLDVSGGSVHYTGGYVDTTILIGADGRKYDIGNATPDRVYVGIAGGFTRHHAAAGITETWSSPFSRRWEPAYTEGRAAGSIGMFAGEGTVLEGSYYAGVITGERQAALGQVAKGGSLKFGELSDSARTWLLGDVTFAGNPVLLPADFKATSQLDTSWYWGSPNDVESFRKRRTYFDTDVLAQSGLSNIELWVSTGFTLAAGEKLDLAPGTTLSVGANTVAIYPANPFTIDGTIRSAGGKVTLAGKFGSSAVIDVSGQVVNRLTDGKQGLAPAINGGTVILGGEFANGMVVDASGGAWLTLSNGKPAMKLGDGGDVTLNGVNSQELAGLDLRGFAAGSGAVLTLGADGGIQIGGTAPDSSSVLHLPATLLGDRGFRSLTISGGDVVIPNDVSAALVPVNVDIAGVGSNFATDAPITAIGSLRVLEQKDRLARQPGVISIGSNGVMTIGAGATLAADVEGRISIAGTNLRINLLGTLAAPAGTVSLAAGVINMASTGRIVASGVDATYLAPNARLRTGQVLGGGTVSLQGVMTLTAGAVIDVSGTRGTIDVGGSRKAEPVELFSDGGSITLTNGTANPSTVDATLLGRAGGAGASGGILSIVDAGTASGSRQNPVTFGSFLGYFVKPASYPAVQTRYDYDPVTGNYAVNPAGLYIFVGNTASGFTDIDINNEIAPALGAIRITSSIMTAINNLITNTTGATRIVKGLAADAPPEASLAPSAVNAGITPEIAFLIDKYFYAAPSRTGTSPNFVYRPAAKINVDSLTPVGMTIGEASIMNGGFSNVSINAPVGLKLSDGVKMQLPASRLSITAPVITAPAAGAIAEIRAAYLSIAGFASTLPNGTPTGGTLTLAASLIDINSATTRGYAKTELVADNIRFVPSGTSGTARVSVDGTLLLSAAQLYPESLLAATVTAADRIIVEQNGLAGLPLSAGGSLTLTAPKIDINGTLRAPFGSIRLAGTAITLGEHAELSVSGEGLLMPYGNIYNNDFWSLPGNTNVTAPPEKRITLEAPVVDLRAGSRINIAGGGDLYAAEFVPGPGGSRDVLAMPGVYAVVPSLSSAIAPSGTVPASSTRIWLAGGNGLAAGWYTLLPGRFALLPGAYAVMMVAGSEGKALAGNVTLNDGTVLMAGGTGDPFTGAQRKLASTWRVMSGDVVRSYTEYNEATANAFYASDAFKLAQYRLTGVEPVTPRLPADGGSLVLKATERLILAGQVQSQAAAGGRGGLVDVAVSKIAVLGKGQDRSAVPAGYLVLDVGQLNALNVDSLLIGGTRTGTNQGLGVTVTASSIIVDNGEVTRGGVTFGANALSGAEIILAATGNIDIAAGSIIVADRDTAGGAGNLIMTQAEASKEYGALIRLSNGDVVQVVRTNVDTTATRGLVSIGAGARLDGGESLLIDSTGDTAMAASAVLAGADIALGASRIGLGGGSGGMVFTEAAIARLAQTKNLTLKSYSTIDIFGGLNVGSVGLKSLTLDTAALVGRASGSVALIGDTIVLRNSSSSAGPSSIPAQASLSVVSDTLVLGVGAKSLRGFASASLSGTSRIVGEGSGSLDAGAADLSLVTPLITGRNGANQSVTTGGALVLASGGTSTTPRSDGSLGSRLSFSGRSVDVGTRIDALGGTVAITAVGGDVVLGAGARVDVGGIAKNFYDVTEYADAGAVTLTSVAGTDAFGQPVGGNVTVASGSMLDLAAAEGGGDAGMLSVVASGGGDVALDGAVNAHAANGKGGSFSLDIAALGDFAGFSQRLDVAGFNTAREFRIRVGNVRLDGTTSLEDFSLAADAGSITVAGAVLARKAYGGSVTITGGNGVIMENGAILAATSSTALGGGRVTIDAGQGRLDLRGGAIDVSGGEGGRVRLRARQVAGPDFIAVDRLAAVITGASSAVLEGVRAYTAVTTSSIQAGAEADADLFVGHGNAIISCLGTTGIAVAAGIEVRSTGDLTVDQDWNLAGRTDHQGTLSLLAAGNLIVNGNISDGFTSAVRSGTLLAQDSWNLRLVAGADLSAADALALRPLAGLAAGVGSITVGDAGTGRQVRTGTGDLDVRAGRDLKLAHYESVVYTAGRRDTTVFTDFTSAAPTATYGILGGDLRIAAQAGISSTLPVDRSNMQLYTEWLNRQGIVNASQLFGTVQSSWWVNYAAFKQGVGALGGGNVNVRAGGDLDNLLVALPTNGRVRGGRTATETKILELRNGGSMTVDAGGAVRAGFYYVGRGEGNIDAGEFAVGRQVTFTNVSTVTVYPIAPILSLGDATLSVRTAGNLRLQTVLDPLMLGAPVSGGHNAFMSGQTERTALDLTSTGGDIVLVGQSSYLSKDRVNVNSVLTPYAQSTEYSADIYPSKLRISSLSGSVTNLGTIYTIAGTRPELRMVAERDVTPGAIVMSRGTPAMMPSAFVPAGGNGEYLFNIPFAQLFRNDIAPMPNPRAYDQFLGSLRNPEHLPNENDDEPSRIYARAGSILSAGITSNEQIWLRAGRDIRTIGGSFRNIHRTDTTVLDAGNDIVGLNFQVQGPGSVLVTAGRDVYNPRILSLGNVSYDGNNRPALGTKVLGLPDGGASIDVMAGLKGRLPDYAAFVAAYLDPANVNAMPDHLTTMVDGQTVPLYLTDAYDDTRTSKQVRFGLVSFIADITGEKLSPLQAWVRFQTLPSLTQQRFIRQIYAQELREAGRDQNGGLLTGGYNRGYSAIDKLFPGKDWHGSVVSPSVFIRTMGGGDINVLTPGGGFQLAALQATVPAGDGVVTLGYGNINIFARDSVTVNRSRILTFAGGDETIWSTLGDIDAGRGAKTTRVPAAPEIQTDIDAVTRVIERADMSGSGIGTVQAFTGVEPGEVDLVAPVGTVNFGDAGVRVSGNFNVAARFVVNVDNLEVKGEVKGVPKEDVKIAPLITETKDKAAADAVKDATQQQNSARPSVIIVEVLGYGGGDGETQTDREKPRSEPEQRSQAPSYDPSSPVQLVGIGALSPEQAQRLSPEERSQLQMR